jgi:hypothetical protein
VRHRPVGKSKKMSKKVIIFIVVLVSFFAINLIIARNHNTTLVDTAFKGIIGSLEIGDKGIPSVYVNGERFHLTTLGREFNNTVKKGDFILKNRGESRYKIVYKNSNRVLNFKFNITKCVFRVS